MVLQKFVDGLGAGHGHVQCVLHLAAEALFIGVLNAAAEADLFRVRKSGVIMGQPGGAAVEIIARLDALALSVVPAARVERDRTREGDQGDDDEEGHSGRHDAYWNFVSGRDENILRK